jgi:outer membrane protein
MKKYLLILAFCIPGFGLMAQSNTTVSYSVGLGVGDLGDYIGKASFRGITLDYRKLVKPNIGVGFSAGWNVFFEDLDRDTYIVENIAVTGKQYRYSNHFPILLSATYYHNPGSMFSPFGGLGFGPMYSIRRTDMNRLAYERMAWNLALQPELGVLLGSNEQNAVSVSVKYNHGFQAGNELEKSQSYFSFNLGVMFF